MICLDRQVSGNEDELGRVALSSPPAYRDDRDAVVFDVEEGGEGTGLLNTEIPSTRPVRQKRKGCCVCCGLEYVLYFCIWVIRAHRCTCIAVVFSGRHSVSL